MGGAGVRLAGGARAEVREDLVDHRRLGDARHDPHGTVAGRARERIDLEDLLEQRRPAAGGLGGRQSWRGDDGGRHRRRGGRLAPHPARAVGIPAVVRCRDVPLVGDVHQHPGQELKRVHGLGARRRAFGLARPIGHRFRRPVVGEPFQGDGIPRAVPREHG